METQTLLDIKLFPRNLPVRVTEDRSLQSDKFFVNIIVSHQIHKYFSTDDDDDADFPEQSNFTAIDTFELQPNTVLSESMISQILSFMGIFIDHQPEIVHHVISFAQSMITNQNYTRPLLIVLIVMGTIVENAVIDHEAAAAAAAAEMRAINESMEMEMEMFRPVPATRSSIEALEKIRFEGLDSSEHYCMICLDKLNSTIEVTRMPCSHLYHGDCIVRWLETSNLCPVCRFQMPT